MHYKLLIATAAAILLAVGVASPAPAQICAEAVSFNLSVAHLSGSEVTQDNPAQMGEVIRYTVTICPAMSWTDNYGNSKWGTAYFDRGIDQPTHPWKVDTADGSHAEKMVYVATTSPPPPPPPPPSQLPTEYTCCDFTSISTPLLMYSTGSVRCWRATAKYGTGIWPFKRVTVQQVTWCGDQVQRKITQHSLNVWHEVSDFGFCKKVSGPHSAKLSGGNGSQFMEYRSQVWFECNVSGLTPNSSKWLEMRYSYLGTAVMIGYGS